VPGVNAERPFSGVTSVSRVVIGASASVSMNSLDVQGETTLVKR
jgi:hypothetical protein